MNRLTNIALAGALACATTAGAADGMREGKWEFKTATKMEGMPAMPAMPANFKLPPGVKLPPGMSDMSVGSDGVSTTYTTCVTNKNPMPMEGKEAKSCTMDSMKQSGNRFDWEVTCKRKDGTVKGTGSATYDGNSMTSTMTMVGNMDGRKVDMVSTTSGRYLGACNGK